MGSITAQSKNNLECTSDAQCEPVNKEIVTSDGRGQSNCRQGWEEVYKMNTDGDGKRFVKHNCIGAPWTKICALKSDDMAMNGVCGVIISDKDQISDEYRPGY